MTSRLLLLLVAFFCAGLVPAQNSKKVQSLKKQQTTALQNIKNTNQQINKTQKTQLQALHLYKRAFGKRAFQNVILYRYRAPARARAALPAHARISLSAARRSAGGAPFFLPLHRSAAGLRPAAPPRRSSAGSERAFISACRRKHIRADARSALISEKEPLPEFRHTPNNANCELQQR